MPRRQVLPCGPCDGAAGKRGCATCHGAGTVEYAVGDQVLLNVARRGLVSARVSGFRNVGLGAGFVRIDCVADEGGFGFFNACHPRGVRLAPPVAVLQREA